MDSWRFTLFFGLQSNTVIIYFVVQTVSALTTGTSFRLVPASFGHGLVQAPPSPALPHFLAPQGIPGSSAPAASVPESAVSPKAVLVPFTGEWYLESKIWVPGMFVVLGCHCLLALSVDKAKQYMYMSANPCRHTYGELVLHRVCMCAYRNTGVYTETDTKINMNSY